MTDVARQMRHAGSSGTRQVFKMRVSVVTFLAATSLICCVVSGSFQSSAFRKEQEEKYPLTELGNSIRRVILAAMLPGVCRSNDWRGELPRYLARVLPYVPIVNWNARKIFEGKEVFNGKRVKGSSVTCGVCQSPDLSQMSRSYRTQWSELDNSDCSSLLSGGIGKGDLVLVIGTGSTGCAYKPLERDTPGCTAHPGDKASFLSLNALDQLWEKNDTLKVHIPVRNLRVLNKPRNIFDMDHIIPDDSFFKPMGSNDAEVAAKLRRCWRRDDKKKDLLYVARYFEYKGQLKFVQQADPELLRGFTIHFYGSGGLSTFTGRKYARAIEATGKERGIKVQVHSRATKLNLMSHACKAAGQVMWPQFDNNPRAAYEGLYAGMPLFISTTAGVPEQLLEQSFVTPVEWNAPLPDFNTKLGRYMENVKANLESRPLRREVVEYTLTALNPDNVYWEICERIGICSHRERIRGVVDDEGDLDGDATPRGGGAQGSYVGSRSRSGVASNADWSKGNRHGGDWDVPDDDDVHVGWHDRG